MTTEFKLTNIFVLRLHINKLIQQYITIKKLIIMENQHQEQSCEKIEVVEKNINLRYDLFKVK